MNTPGKLHPKFQSGVVDWGRTCSCGIYKDGAGNKLLHIAGIRSSNGQDDASRDIPITIYRDDGVIAEASAEVCRL